MRIDRMLGIIVLLLNRDKISARNLSGRFEVSIRTIYRDIEAINMAGIPIVSSSGNNGGFSIMENYRLDRQVLSFNDMTSIITALKGVSNSLGNTDLDNIAEKILNLVPRDKIDRLKKHFEEIVIDISPWGSKQKSKEFLKVLQNAITGQVLVNFSYKNMRGEQLLRTVEPMTLLFKGYAWYLFGYCRFRKDFRLFRLSRMSDIEVTNDKFIRKEVSYNDVLNSSSANTKTIDLVIKFIPDARIKVEEYFNEDCVRFLDDGSMIVSVSFPEDEWVYSTILSFGEQAEVIQPTHLREIIRKKAENISMLYKHDIQLS